MTTSCKLADYDTRNPPAIALWAYNTRGYWIGQPNPEPFDEGYRAGRIAAMELLLEGILGTRDIERIREHLIPVA